MRVLVCGGRDFDNAAFVFNMLSEYEEHYGPFSHLIHGGATGADTEAGNWAKYRHLPQTVYQAAWRKHGKKAGPMRNQRMLDEGKPDLVIAFPGGKGTADMMRRAEAAGVPVIDVARKAWPDLRIKVATP